MILTNLFSSLFHEKNIEKADQSLLLLIRSDSRTKFLFQIYIPTEDVIACIVNIGDLTIEIFFDVLSFSLVEVLLKSLLDVIGIDGFAYFFQEGLKVNTSETLLFHCRLWF